MLVCQYDTTARQIAEATTRDTETQRVVQNMDDGRPAGLCRFILNSFYDVSGKSLPPLTNNDPVRIEEANGWTTGGTVLHQDPLQ